MNEKTGFLTCPKCKMPWDSEQWCCGTCGGTERPKALRAPGPTWAWLLIASVLLLGAAVDLSLGGHVLQLVQGYLRSGD